MIKGDLDSLRPDVRTYYESMVGYDLHWPPRLLIKGRTHSAGRRRVFHRPHEMHSRGGKIGRYNTGMWPTHLFSLRSPRSSRFCSLEDFLEGLIKPSTPSRCSTSSVTRDPSAMSSVARASHGCSTPVPTSSRLITTAWARRVVYCPLGSILPWSLPRVSSGIWVSTQVITSAF